MEGNTRNLVNPVSVARCHLKFDKVVCNVLDMSYLRVVIADVPDLPTEFGEAAAFELDSIRFQAKVVKQGSGPGWVRLGFERLVPSIQAHLRSFLSARKIGESLWEDWQTDQFRHFHGLNECELWIHRDGGVLFTLLDSTDIQGQFLVRLAEPRGPLQAGRMKRKDYMELSKIDGDLPLDPLTDRETFTRLSECRDILTNFRPVQSADYSLKQRLLKALNESLYSRGRKVEMGPRPVSA